MRADREGLDTALRAKAKKVLETMCNLDGINFAALRDELDWNDRELQECLTYLNSLGYVAARVLPTMKMRYSVTELGWTASELLASLDDHAPRE